MASGETRCKVLAAYPDAFAKHEDGIVQGQSRSDYWEIWVTRKDRWASKVAGSGSTEQLAWENAANRLPSSPATGQEPQAEEAVCSCGVKIIRVPTRHDPNFEYWRRDGTGEVCVEGHWHTPAAPPDAVSRELKEPVAVKIDSWAYDRCHFWLMSDGSLQKCPTTQKVGKPFRIRAAGERVVLAPPNEPATVTVTTHEWHNGLLFYRVQESIGSLFLESSFKVDAVSEPSPTQREPDAGLNDKVILPEKGELSGVTVEDAVKGLEDIFADLQTRFHDQWDWLNAYFYVKVLKAYASDPVVQNGESPVSHTKIPPINAYRHVPPQPDKQASIIGENGHSYCADVSRPDTQEPAVPPEGFPEHVICTFDPKDHHEIDLCREHGFFRNADGSFICDVHEMHRRGAEIASLREQLAAREPMLDQYEASQHELQKNLADAERELEEADSSWQRKGRIAAFHLAADFARGFGCLMEIVPGETKEEHTRRFVAKLSDAIRALAAQGEKQ